MVSWEASKYIQFEIYQRDSITVIINGYMFSGFMSNSNLMQITGGV